VLEFIALVALRVREPNLERPFRIPGGIAGVTLLGVCPTLLLVFSAVNGEHEHILGMNALWFGVLLIVAGFVAYAIKFMVPSGPRPGAAADVK